MMRTSLCIRTLPYLRMAVSAVTEMESWTKPVMNQATQCTALFRPIIFITCEAKLLSRAVPNPVHPCLHSHWAGRARVAPREWAGHSTLYWSAEELSSSSAGQGSSHAGDTQKDQLSLGIWDLHPPQLM